jgi:hypothetical protein
MAAEQSVNPSSSSYTNQMDIQSDTVTPRAEGTDPSDFVSDPSGPLGSLFKSKYNYKQVQYPADLNSSGKGHAILFDVYDVDTVTLEEMGQAAVKLYNAVGDTLQNVSAAGLKQSGTEFVAATKAAIANPGAAFDKAATKLSEITGIAASSTREFVKTQKTFRESVMLYIPDTLTFSYNVEFGEISLMGAVESVPGVGQVAGKVQSILDSQAGKLILNKLGYAFNPQAQAMFQGIHFRPFNMSFTFTPRSAQEAIKVKQIIKTFRSYAAPTILDGSGGFFYTPPGIFKLTFLKDGLENSNINKLTDSVLIGIDVNYSPSGTSFHKDGQPVQTTMDLSFQEIVLVDRNKINEGY